MQDSESLSRYFPDQTPTWFDVILVFLLLIALVTWTPQFFEATAIYWPALLLSFIVTTAFVMLTQQSEHAAAVNQRWGDLPMVVRLAVVALGLAGLLVVAPTLPGSDGVHFGVAMGAVIGVLVYLVAWILLARAVKRW